MIHNAPTHIFAATRRNPDFSYYPEVKKALDTIFPGTPTILGHSYDEITYNEEAYKLCNPFPPRCRLLLILEALTVRKKLTCFTIDDEFRRLIEALPGSDHVETKTLIVADPNYVWSSTDQRKPILNGSQQLQNEAAANNIPLVMCQRDAVNAQTQGVLRKMYSALSEVEVALQQLSR